MNWGSYIGYVTAPLGDLDKTTEQSEELLAIDELREIKTMLATELVGVLAFSIARRYITHYNE